MADKFVKRPALALAALGLAMGAHAQSSVTLYGTVDAGLVYTNNQQTTHADGSTSGHANYQLAGGNLVPSRWGLMGTEDIGGGTAVNFTLENSFLIGNGAMLQSNTLFNRNAWVGLNNGTYGALTFGRQYDPFSDFLGAYVSSNNWATLYGSHFGDVDNLNEAFNFNNSIKYISPSFGGFTLGGLFSLGGVAGDFSRNKGWALAANYVHGPLSLSAGYLELNQPLDAALGGANGYIGDFSCANPGASYCLLQDASKVRIVGAGGSYAFGKASVALTYTHTRLSQSQYFAGTARPDGADISFDIAELNTTYALAPDLQLGFAYIFNDARVSGSASTRVHQVNLGAVYSLSKRTAVYAVAIGQKSSGAGLAIDPSTGATRNLAQIPNIVNSDSDKQLSVIVGLRHNF
ncbi:porin [Paraburkholderia fynbosensis]|uniref:Outer membrane porin protein n=1 Tax=Paraburkholderia fynbosensis TaxID=1200993 RepID=A0A6J5FE74_9BURK|nr:porin [Paraburkholderia fynbosensis]CAB3776164.1 Outer membrane porin protein [Paraburkholderia fynbosensis]